MYSFAGDRPPKEILEAVRRGEIAAFCLFAAINGDSPASLRGLTETLHRAAREGGNPPPLIGIDQEGGQLIAVAGGATELPGNMALGATRSPELAEQAGHVLGRELLAMGVNVNFAPSLDVNVNPDNPVIGIRSFGDDPALVAELGAAMIRGIQAEGVIATAKHFPGHGDTRADSHLALPVVPHPRERLDAVELPPFRAAVRAGVGAIMTAHVLFPALDPDEPATLSAPILRGLLRGEMGFEGLIITDAMDMQAVARLGAEIGARRALEAGVDLVLLGFTQDQLELGHKMRSLASPEAIARIRAAQERLPTGLPSLAVVGCDEHREIAQTIADRSITPVRGGERLPLRPAPGDKLLVVTPKPTNLTPADTSSLAQVRLADAIRRRHSRTEWIEIRFGAPDEDVAAVLNEADKADQIVIGTISADRDPSQAALVRELIRRGRSPIVIALRTPYDITAFPNVDVYLCAYSIRDVSTEAAAKALFGEIEPTGTLPCAIPGVEV